MKSFSIVFQRKIIHQTQKKFFLQYVIFHVIDFQHNKSN